MAHENIRSTANSFTVDADGYFCTFNTTLNILQKTTQTSNVAFTYPTIDPILVGSYGSLLGTCYDGYYFWTLHREGSTRRSWSEYNTTDYGNYVYDFAIKKWTITKNNTVEKVEQFDIINDDRDNVVIPTSFCLEPYTTTYPTTVSGNNPYIKTTADWSSRLEPGDVVFLGPNSSSQSEYVTVTGTIAPNTWGLSFYTYHTYDSGDSILFNEALHVFNQFCPTSDDYTTKGSWLRYNATTGTLVASTIDAEYKDIDATAFGNTSALTRSSNFNTLVYIKNNSAKFININTLTVAMVMNTDNIQANGSTIIPVHDLELRNGSLYRLQLRAMYYEADYTWSTYNYVLSPIREYLDSISTSVFPTILPSNGVSTAQVTAVVHDQYNNPKRYSILNFEDDNDTGFMAHSTVYSNVYGVALATYFSGLSPANVTITITALQDN